MRNWNQVWNKEERIADAILEMLIKADGFDCGAGAFSLTNWEDYVGQLIHKLNIEPGSSVFEVGCGSGAFLYPFFKRNNSVGGLDFSEVLLYLAKAVMRDGEFVIAEAVQMDANKKYDLVLSHAVFHYFPDHEYAELVLEKMVKKSKNKIAILDVNDEDKEERYHLIRSKEVNAEEYRAKYKGLKHLFYNKKWFLNFAKKHGLKIEIFDQDFKEYGNSELRFNVIMERND